jgi:1,2-diacylglycerol 3-beta-galactosyltransferase
MNITSSRSLELIYFDYGGGHRNASEALEHVFKEQYPHWNVRRVNLFSDVLRQLDPVHCLTKNSLKPCQSEDFYNTLLQRGLTYGFGLALPLTQRAIKLSSNAMEELLRQHWQGSQPDLVVSLIPNFNEVMFKALQTVQPQTPYVTVMTDMADVPPNFWQAKQDQFMICGSEMALRQSRQTGYREERIFKTTGMIIKPQFYVSSMSGDERWRRLEREKLRLDPDLPTAFIMFGGHGAKVAAAIVERLNNSNLAVQTIVMCGHNKELLQSFQGVKGCCPVGFTSDQVPYYMGLADFFIGKPGPGSLSEALHMGLPVIVNCDRSTMPQERPNVDWVRDNKLGLVVNNFKNIVAAVRWLLEGDRLTRFRQNAKSLDNRAVFEIPLLLDRMMDDTDEKTYRFSKYTS